MAKKIAAGAVRNPPGGSGAEMAFLLGQIEGVLSLDARPPPLPPNVAREKPPRKGAHGLPAITWCNPGGRTHRPDPARVREAALAYVVSWWGETLTEAVVRLTWEYLIAQLGVRLKQRGALRRLAPLDARTLGDELSGMQERLRKLALESSRPEVAMRLRTSSASLARVTELAAEDTPPSVGDLIALAQGLGLHTLSVFLRRVRRKLPHLPQSATVWACFAIAAGIDPVPADADELQTVARPRWATALKRSKP